MVAMFCSSNESSQRQTTSHLENIIKPKRYEKEASSTLLSDIRPSRQLATLNDETVTLTRSELRALLEAVNSAPPGGGGGGGGGETPLTTAGGGGGGGGDYYHRDIYRSDNPDGEESGYPTSPEVGLAGSRYNHQHHRRGGGGEDDVAFSSDRKRDTFSTFSEGSLRSSKFVVNSSSKSDLKRRQWLKEKEEEEESRHLWDPWGKPGGGAPSKIINNNPHPGQSSLPYSSREGESQHLSNGTGANSIRAYSGQSSVTTAATSYNANRPLPDFIRSSIPFGPNIKKMPEGGGVSKSEEIRRANDRWYSDGRATSPPGGAISPTSSLATLAPSSFARGQGMSEPLDAETISKRIEKRQKMFEYQSFIKCQMEEKQKREAQEKERKRIEEECEEKRLEEERIRIKEQYDSEQKQHKLKEEQEERKRQILVAAVKSAQESAEAEKKARLASRRKAATMSSSSSPPPPPPPFNPEPISTVSHHPGSPGAIDNSVDVNDSISQQDLKCWSVEEKSKFVGETKLKPNPSVEVVIKEDKGKVNLLLKGRELGVQTDPSRSPYVQNRLLTPSMWRIKERLLLHRRHFPADASSSVEADGGGGGGGGTFSAWGQLREMGTQTENVSSRSFDSSSSSSCPGSASQEQEQHLRHNTKLHHHHHHQQQQQQRPPKTNDQTNENIQKKRNDNERGGGEEENVTNCFDGQEDRRPQWGVNRPVKNFVKMTERDPNYNRRKKLQEMRKEHWQRELATQRILYQTKRSTILVENGVQDHLGALGVHGGLRGTVNYPRRRRGGGGGGEGGSSSSLSERASTANSVYSDRNDRNCPPSSSSSLHPHHHHPVVGVLGSTFTISKGQRAYTRVTPSSREDSGTSRESPTMIVQPQQLLQRTTGNAGRVGGGTLLPLLSRRWSRSTEHSDFESEDGDDERDEQRHHHPAAGERIQQQDGGAGGRRKWRSQENFFINKVSDSVGNPEESDDDGQLNTPAPRRKWSQQDTFDLEKVSLLRSIANRNNILETTSSPPPAPARERATSADPSSKRQQHRLLERMEAGGGGGGGGGQDSLASGDLDQRLSEEHRKMNSSILKSHPTARQDKILQQLSTLRQGLLLKQREIENLLLHSP